MCCIGKAALLCNIRNRTLGILQQPESIIQANHPIKLFQILTRHASIDPERAIGLMTILAEQTGMPNGICAGQGWESEQKIDLRAYHRAKTGALFVAATQMGAIAAGQDGAQ